MNRSFRPRQALKETLKAILRKKNRMPKMLLAMPKGLALLEAGLRILDQDFPIREGHSRIDFLAANPDQSLTFVWARERCHPELLAQMLPDFDWIRKNRALWAHLYPELARNRAWRMRMWIFACEIDPQVKFLLERMKDIEVEIFLARPKSKGPAWEFFPWDEAPIAAKSEAPTPPAESGFPSHPPAPPPSSAKKSPSALINPEELKDLLTLVPPPAPLQESEDEVTDPFYELRR